jgi:hypothetical protein
MRMIAAAVLRLLHVVASTSPPCPGSFVVSFVVLRASLLLAFLASVVLHAASVKCTSDSFPFGVPSLCPGYVFAIFFFYFF